MTGLSYLVTMTMQAAARMKEPALENRVLLSLVPQPAPCAGDLFRHNAAHVARTLRRLGVTAASLDDAVQDVFIVVMRHLSKFRPGSSERAWLSAIALRVASDYRRAHKRRRLTPLDECLPQGPGQSPFDHVVRSQSLSAVMHALDSLPEVQREVFLLADVEEMTAPEIAALTGAKVPTVYTRLLTARRRFGEALSNTQDQKPKPKVGAMSSPASRPIMPQTSSPARTLAPSPSENA
jgi:RNA polymerase sigma-70 factor (ECF subfamily)